MPTSLRAAWSAGDRHVLFALLLAFRLLDALALRTFFQPDEFFQALEPAWALAFGTDSGAWLTWEWRHELRSSLHPTLFAAGYLAADALAAAMGLSPTSRAHLLLAAPKALQAVVAACVDLATLALAEVLYSPDDLATWFALPLSLLSPWQFFCSVRTLSNSLETALTAAALSLWPFATAAGTPAAGGRVGPAADRGPRGSVRRLRASLTLAALATCLRPTNVLIWAPLGVQLLASNSLIPRLRVLRETVACGSIVVFLTTLADRWYYGLWTFPPLRFLYFNINQNLAVFYGKNRRDYYLSEGLPLLLTTALPFALLGMYRSLWSTNGFASLAWMTASFTFCLSLISHKEVRFLFPILPALHVLAAWPFARLVRSRGSLKKLVLGLVVALDLAVALYTTQVHQRGVIDVVHFLRADHEARMARTEGAVTTVGFLMPCHSTPWRSHFVHGGIRAWALTCEPPVDVPLDARDLYVDEADRFYADPVKWIDKEMAEGGSGPRPWPQRVVFFEQLLPAIGGILGERGYRECWRGFNSHWHDDWRRRGDVLVWCRESSSS